ncbi:TlpA family protein disulfide reductase [Synoicihabitans lomoniglobus]|uniref:TlpA disulfide reductase family protein n=1 Tax=Synoicihabitans lomoniglobus TaxID=2909285 RepID=A0AAF0CMI2_9BACT|nr:TlpA family protein disulfide reductase [Opitutaceae bacterium LMO-M01]WED63306.1 TlpA disulfide reductase family protein [Opitutaceae bacterium LMO-M01]
MHRLPRLFAFLFTMVFTTAALPAQDETPAEPSPIETEFLVIDTRIREKIAAGSEDFAAEAADFSALLAKYADDSSEDVARLNLMHAMFLLQVMNDEKAAFTALRGIATKYADTDIGNYATDLIQRVERAMEKQALSEQLTGQPAPEIDFTWSTQDGLTHLSDLKGKVVVLDFWATWCGPCVATFPQIAELRAHYDAANVAIVGVTSLQGRVHGLEAAPIMTRDDPEREYALTADFMTAKDMTWTVAFSAQKVFNPDYGVSGIPHMVIIAPDGTVRHPALHPAMPHAEKLAMIDAILTEFDLPVPAHN